MWMLMLNFYVNVICFDLSPRSNWIYRLIYLSLLLIYVYLYIYNVYILSYYSYLCSYLTLVSRLSVWLRFRFNCSIVFVVGLFVWLLLYCLTDSHTHTHTHTSEHPVQSTPCMLYLSQAQEKKIKWHKIWSHSSQFTKRPRWQALTNLPKKSPLLYSQKQGGSMPNTSSSVPFLLSSSMQSIRSRRTSTVLSSGPLGSGSGILQQLGSGMVRQLTSVSGTVSPVPLLRVNGARNNNNVRKCPSLNITFSQ